MSDFKDFSFDSSTRKTVAVFKGKKIFYLYDVFLSIPSGGGMKLSDIGSAVRHIGIIMDGNGRWAKLRGQSAHSQFYFTDTLWPDFDRKQLIRAISDYQMRT